MPFILISLVIVLLLSLKLPIVKGIIGEMFIKIIIGRQSTQQGKEKFVIHNLLLQDENGKTSQTDHVVINSEGVFVIETKNYSGRIYGNDSQREWTQVLNYGKVKNHFYSPVRQNYTHVCRIKEIIPDGIPIYSIVVFVKGNISYINSKDVYTPFELFKIINSKKSKQLSMQEMQTIFALLSDHDKSSEISNYEHVANIHNTQRDIENNICPRCQGQLVVRNGKNGNFMGCSNYPKCRFTKNI